MTPPGHRATISDMHAADVARFTEQISALRREFTTHDEKDTETQALIFAELNTVKRLVWIQIGGIAALAWIVGAVSHDILKYLK